MVAPWARPKGHRRHGFPAHFARHDPRMHGLPADPRMHGLPARPAPSRSRPQTSAESLHGEPPHRPCAFAPCGQASVAEAGCPSSPATNHASPKATNCDIERPRESGSRKRLLFNQTLDCGGALADVTRHYYGNFVSVKGRPSVRRCSEIQIH